MILYLDTSSLVKLYIEETHSNAVREWVREAEIVATCRIAYPETISALNRRVRAGDLSKRVYRDVAHAFSLDWRNIATIDFDEIEAGRLAEKHGLRGLDAVHLSSAKLLKERRGRISLAFSSFDEPLNEAAVSEKLAVLRPGE